MNSRYQSISKVLSLKNDVKSKRPNKVKGVQEYVCIFSTLISATTAPSQLLWTDGHPGELGNGLRGTALEDMAHGRVQQGVGRDVVGEQFGFHYNDGGHPCLRVSQYKPRLSRMGQKHTHSGVQIAKNCLVQ